MISQTFLKSSLVFSFALLVLLFNNCKGNSQQALMLESSSQSSTSASDSSQGSGATGTLCEQDLKNLYARGWQTFLKTNCTICHSNGPGKGRFANSDLQTAFTDFQLVGYVKVSNNAINPAHNPPYTGIQHTQQVNELKLEWQKGLQNNATCTGDTSALPQESQIDKITLKTSPQAIGLAADGDKKVFTWTINSDLTRVKGADSLPNIPNGQISITATRLKNASGFTYYTFSSPTIYGAGVDTRIQGIFISVNGFLLNYPTTFSYIDKSIRSGSANDLTGLISTGSLVVPKVILPTDTVTLSFINISSVVLPAPPPPNTVNISGARTLYVTPNTGFMDITLSLTSPAVEPTIVTLSENTSTCATNTLSAMCLPEVYNMVCPNGACDPAAKDFGLARSVVGTTYNRYDWDYKILQNTVSFAYGEQTKVLRVTFSKDIRREKNRILTLSIASILGPVLIGTNEHTNFVINKYNNPVSDPNILSFSDLMNPQSGILGQNCVKCHNSKDTAGGYDMTDYQMMIDRRVLIPRDVASKMYVRMHPNPEFLAKPMPQDGFLTQSKILEVEKWLLDGAKNN